MAAAVKTTVSGQAAPVVVFPLSWPPSPYTIPRRLGLDARAARRGMPPYARPGLLRVRRPIESAFVPRHGVVDRWHNALPHPPSSPLLLSLSQPSMSATASGTLATTRQASSVDLHDVSARWLTEVWSGEQEKYNKKGKGERTDQYYSRGI